MADSTENGRALGSLIFETLRLAGRLTLSGDALMKDIGLTSARWQIIGVITFLPSPRTVSDLARTMGLSRQAVQRIVNDLHSEGIVCLLPNPAHKRAPLVALTEKGTQLHEEAELRRIPWTEDLVSGLDGYDLKATSSALSALRHRLEKMQSET
ncbi:MAG: MarR family transcriptional regulator [Hoeflea sp.]|nr:MarR family transcriptional regulator [Hoeflea sp.]|tara:strand:+ start:23905 stop:24366 length:462 start_codon:yes stop_codon:yes gene_type:complete